MYLLDGSVVTSASDLKKASECEFAFLRELDVKLGRDTLFEAAGDAMMARAGQLGNEHEHRVLERYRAQFGDAVVEIEQPSVRDADAVAAAVAATVTALESGAPVVYQATFAEDGFIGFADFIVRQPDGRYRVQDSKLARHARVTALLQLAAYAEQLDRLGIPLRPRGRTAAGRRHDEPAPPRRHHSRLPQPCRAPARDHRRPRGRHRPGRLGRSALPPRRPLPDLRARGAGAPRRAHGRRAAGHPARAPRGRRHHDDRRARGIRRPGAVRARRHARRAARAGPAAAAGRGRAARRRGRGHALARRSAAAAPGVGARGACAGRDPRAEQGRPLLRLRGRPALHRGRRHPVEPRLPLGHGRHRRALHRVLGALVRRRARGARQVPRVREAASSRAPRPAHLSLRQLRAHAPHLDRRAPRRRRVRRRPAARRRGARRPLPHRQARGARGQPVVLHQEARAALHGRRRAAPGRREIGRRLDHRVRSGARPRRLRAPRGRDRGARDPRRPRRLQRVRLPLDPATARLAARPRPPRRRAVGADAGAHRAGRRQGLRALTARRAPARTRRSRRPRARRRSHRARARRGRHRLPRARGEELLVEPLPAHRPARRGLARPPRRARGRSARLSRDAGVAQRAAVEQRPSRDPAHRRHRTRLQVLARQRGVPALRVAGTLPLAFAAPGPARHDRRGHPRGHRGRSRGRRAGRRRRDVVGAAHGDHPRSTSEHQRPARRDRRVGSADPRHPAAAAAQPRHGRAAPAPAARHGRARAARAGRRVRR